MQIKYILVYGLSFLLIIVNMTEFSVLGIYGGLGAAVWNFVLGLIFSSIILLFKKPKPSVIKKVNLALAIGIIFSLFLKLTSKG